MSTPSMSSLKTWNRSPSEPSYHPGSSIQLALNKSLWDEQRDMEMGGTGHRRDLSCPSPKLGEVVSALSHPGTTCRGCGQGREFVSDAVSSPDPESCPTQGALGRLRCLALNCDSAEEDRKGGEVNAGAQKGFASHFSLSKAQSVPRNEDTQKRRNLRLCGALGSPVLKVPRGLGKPLDHAYCLDLLFIASNRGSCTWHMSCPASSGLWTPEAVQKHRAQIQLL